MSTATPVKYAEPLSIPHPGCHFAQSLSIDVKSLSKGDAVGELVTYCAYDTSKGNKETMEIAETHPISKLDEKCGGVLKELILTEEFNGKEGKSHSVRITPSDKSVKHVLFIGLGEAHPSPQATPYGHVKAGRSLSSVVQATKAKSLTIYLPHLTQPHHVRALFFSLWIDLTPDNRFKSADNKKRMPQLTSVTVVVSDDSQLASITEMVSDSKRLAHGTRYAQELVNAPPNYATPKLIAESALLMAAEVGLRAKILDVPEIESLGMGGLMSVGKGSVNQPRFIHLTYTPKGEVKKRIALVGKGITFDSGGYNLKVNSLIELMKFDMGGGAAVLGAAKIVGLAKPEGVEAHFIVPAAENMIDSSAYRPSDVITASNGKTIEIHNTDAEGRLVLADGLVYAERLGVDTVIDIATLTGACMVALGLKTGGVWGSNQELVKRICATGESQGEPMWGMPLVTEYRKDFDSKIADMKNAGSRYAGSICAALFLKEFVTEGVEWAHVDIAGPAWDHKDSMATGYGARTLSALVCQHGLGKSETE